MQGLNELMLLLTSRCTKSCAPFCKRDGARAVSTSRRDRTPSGCSNKCSCPNYSMKFSILY